MAVVDNNLLSSLAKVKRLGRLPEAFDTVMTTPSVLDELHRDALAGYAFVDRIDAVKPTTRLARGCGTDRSGDRTDRIRP